MNERMAPYNIRYNILSGSVSLFFMIECSSFWGGIDLERGYGNVQPWSPPPPFSRLSCSSQGSHFKQKSVHKIWKWNETPFWENLEILASTASIFAKILVHKPPNLEIFSSQAPKFGDFQFTSPLFQRQVSVCKPHTSEIWATHPNQKKKLSATAPPPPSSLDSPTCLQG